MERTCPRCGKVNPPESKFCNAARHKRFLVTRNRNDFIRLTLPFMNDHRPNSGVLVVPYSLPGDQFARIATRRKTYASRHPAGLEPYQVNFLSNRT